MLVGLTGNIGSGKSSVAKILKELGCEIVDVDALMDKTIVETNCFGWGMEHRSDFVKHIFNNDALYQMVERIMVSRVVWEANKLIGINPHSIIVVDAPLLFESHFHEYCDWTITVVAKMELRHSRATARLGLPLSTIEFRESKQIPQKIKASNSLVVIENNGTMEDLEKRTQEVYEYMNYLMESYVKKSLERLPINVIPLGLLHHR